MSKNILLKSVGVALAVALVSVNPGRADQAQGKIVSHGRVLVVPAPKTSAINGRQMYGSYCATCHGLNGKGDGPVSSVLKVRPTDLTVLSRNHQGKYPSAHVLSVIQDGLYTPAHGTAFMPVWGPVLGKMDPANPAQRQLRVANLSRYLESIQTR